MTAKPARTRIGELILEKAEGGLTMRVDAAQYAALVQYCEELRQALVELDGANDRAFARIQALESRGRLVE